MSISINPESPKEELTGVYGVKWNLYDDYDLGERCFDSEGRKAVIGVGNTNGFSDFDYIYPWSRIKRCNIIKASDGTERVVYEGDPEFTLDGGIDVFVRIPKFYYERYQRDGYEYRTVSASGKHVHPVFIENNKELEEIFVSAFEGWIGEDNYLYSVSDVIPTSNVYGINFFNAAQTRGENYTLYDNRAVDAIFTLMAIEFGSRNSNSFLGYGFADYWQPVDKEASRVRIREKQTNCVVVNLLPKNELRRLPVGSNITICKGSQYNVIAQRTVLAIEQCKETGYSKIFISGDPIDLDMDCFIGSAACSTNFCETCGVESRLYWHTGRAEFIPGSRYQNPIRYRWMENLWGSLWSYLPDVSFLNGQMYVCRNMKDYKLGAITSSYEKVGELLPINEDNGSLKDKPGNNYWVTSLVYDDSSLGVSFGNSYDKSLLSTNAFGAYYYLSNGLVCIVNGGGFDHVFRCNILTNRAWVGPKTRWYLYGARLLYKNVKGSGNVEE